MKLKVSWYDEEKDMHYEELGTKEFQHDDLCRSSDEEDKFDLFVEDWEIKIGCIDQCGDNDYYELNLVELTDNVNGEKTRQDIAIKIIEGFEKILSQ